MHLASISDTVPPSRQARLVEWLFDPQNWHTPGSGGVQEILDDYVDGKFVKDGDYRFNRENDVLTGNGNDIFKYAITDFNPKSFDPKSRGVPGYASNVLGGIAAYPAYCERVRVLIGSLVAVQQGSAAKINALIEGAATHVFGTIPGELAPLAHKGDRKTAFQPLAQLTHPSFGQIFGQEDGHKVGGQTLVDGDPFNEEMVAVVKKALAIMQSSDEDLAKLHYIKRSGIEMGSLYAASEPDSFWDGHVLGTAIAYLFAEMIVLSASFHEEMEQARCPAPLPRSASVVPPTRSNANS